MSANESKEKRTTTEPEPEVNKKQKLDNEVCLATTLPILSNTLVLDKVQEDTINQLVQSSSLVTETIEKVDPVVTEETNKTIEQEIVSADIEKPVTETTEQEKTSITSTTANSSNTNTTTTPATTTDDLNITSEQLLFALTSIPPTEVTGTTKSTSNTDEESNSVKELIAPETPGTTLPVLDIEVPPPPVPVTLASTNGLGITPNKPTTPNSIPPPAAAASTSTTSITNLPDISAALRRLSSGSHSVPASVIEKLSSSPRLPNIGHLNTNERRSSMADVSPSEMLGNALAAVAANAAAASRSSPKPSQPQNSVTAIGNLAAITANISNLLHSGGFHRNSFSQEDTQKLAAAVAVARNGNGNGQPQRRKSSMAVVGNAFSNMIEMMGRNKPTHKPKLIIKNDQVWKSLQGVPEKSLGFQLYTPQLILPHLENCLNGTMEIRVPARYLTFENTRVKKRALWGTDIYTDDSDIVAMAIHSGKYQPQFIEPDIEADDPFALAVAGKQRESIEAAKKLALSGKKWIRHDSLIPDHDLKVTVRVLPTLKNYASCIRYRLKSREWGKHDGMSLFVEKVEKIKKGDARLKGRSTIKSNIFAYEHYRKQALGLTASQQQKISTPVSTQDLIQDVTHYQRGRVKKTPRVMRMFKIRSEMMNNNDNSVEK